VRRSPTFRAVCAGPPAEVTGEQLVGWFGRQTHWKPETLRNYCGTARGFFGWAYRKGLVPGYLGDALPSVRTPPPAPERPGFCDLAGRWGMSGVARGRATAVCCVNFDAASSSRVGIRLVQRAAEPSENSIIASRVGHT